MALFPSTTAAKPLQRRCNAIFEEREIAIWKQTDRLFSGLLVSEYLIGIAISIWVSPLTWIGLSSKTHPHVWSATILGAIIVSLPLYFAWSFPARAITRHTIAAAQMLNSALIIHLCGGRIEAHFHVFGSLAFLAFYRDWRVLVTATIVVAAEHLARGIYWPQSVFGVATASPWRAMEHVAWVAFEDLFIIWSCRQSTREMRSIAEQQMRLEAINERIESDVTERTADLVETSKLSTFAAEIGKVLVSEGELQRALQLCAETIVTHIDMAFVRIWTTDTSGQIIVPDASAALFTQDQGPFGWDATDGIEIRTIADERISIHSNNLESDPRIGNRPWAIREGMVSFAGYPLIVEDRIVGVIAMFARHSISAETVKRLGFVANSIALGIERIRSEVALKHATVVAEKASLAKSQFLANMSHELRTPMNAIIGYSEILSEDVEDQGQHQYLSDLKKIRAAGNHLLGLINDILDVAKIEAGKMDVHFEEFEFAMFLDDVVTTVQPLIDLKGNTLIVQSERDLGRTYSDQTKIRQILFNLIGNAAKFTENGTIILEARRVNHGERDFLELIVSDSGIGMTPEQLSRIGEPFVQAELSTTRRFGGTGLGLTITKRFCELLGGKIAIESEPNVGSRFTVVIPAEHGQQESAESENGLDSTMQYICADPKWSNESTQSELIYS